MPWTAIEFNSFEVSTIAILTMLVITAAGFMPETTDKSAHTRVLWMWIGLLVLSSLGLVVSAVIFVCQMLTGRGGKPSFGIKFPFRKDMKVLAGSFRILCESIVAMPAEMSAQLVEELSDYDRMAIDSLIVMVHAVTDGSVGVLDGISGTCLSIPSETMKASIEAHKKTLGPDPQLLTEATI